MDLGRVGETVLADNHVQRHAVGLGNAPKRLPALDLMVDALCLREDRLGLAGRVPGDEASMRPS